MHPDIEGLSAKKHCSAACTPSQPEFLFCFVFFSPRELEINHKSTVLLLNGRTSTIRPVKVLRGVRGVLEECVLVRVRSTADSWSLAAVIIRLLVMTHEMLMVEP